MLVLIKTAGEHRSVSRNKGYLRAFGMDVFSLCTNIEDANDLHNDNDELGNLEEHAAHISDFDTTAKQKFTDIMNNTPEAYTNNSFSNIICYLASDLNGTSSLHALTHSVPPSRSLWPNTFFGISIDIYCANEST